MKRILCLVAMVGLGVVAGCSHNPTFISGNLVQYQPVTLDFNGPTLWEVGPANPFTDYRMTVRFTKDHRVLDVPGYFAADGRAADTSATHGSVWRVHFLPDEPGEWKYEATLLFGLNAAVSETAQVTAVSFSGAKGKLKIAPVTGDATGFYRTGPLRKDHLGLHFDDGTPFAANYAAEPTNFLACADFDGTRAADQPLHDYREFVKDWIEGQPTWQNGKGQGIIGKVNHLAAQGVNGMAVSTYNIDGGPHQDVHVWSTPADRHHFAIARLAQWDIVFSHMNRAGVAVQLVLQESGNARGLSEGQLGMDRKLYYRELVARFAHHPGLIWNVGPADGNADDQADFADYLRKLDPYKRPIIIPAAGDTTTHHPAVESE